MPERIGYFLFLALMLSCGKQEQAPPSPTPLTAEKHNAEFQNEIHTFCSHCHRFPKPDVLTRAAWRMQIPREYAHYEQSTNQNLRVPPMSAVIRYFVSQAPEAHQLPAQTADILPGPVDFQRQKFPRQPDDSLPGISNLNWVTEPKSNRELLLTDLGSGKVGRIRFESGQPDFQLLAKLNHPAHIERIDLNQDGYMDYLIADLGSFGPEDHDRGSVEALIFNTKTRGYD